MSKNLTRKGLAFGALVALGSSVIAGTPALAADSMVLAANYSTDATLAAPVTEALTLNASLAPGSVAANISTLTYKIVTDGTFTVGASIAGAKVDSITSVANVATVEATSASNGNAVFTKSTPLTAGYNYGTSTGTAGVFGASGTVRSAAYVRPTTATSPSAQNTLTLKLDAIPATNGTTGAAVVETTATKTVTVVAFLDANNNGLLETGETQQSVDVKFVKFSEITTSTEITAPVEGDKAVTALVKFTNVNAQALTVGKVGAYFTKGDGTQLGKTFDVTALAISTNDATATADNDLLAGDTVTTAGFAPSSYNKTGAAVTGTPTSTEFVYTNNAGAAITDGVGTAVRTDDAAGRGNVALVAGTATYRGQTVVSYSTTLGGFKFVTGAVNALVKATAVKVQPLFDSTALTTAQNTDVTQKIGSAQTASVTTRALSSFKGTHVLSTTAASASADTTVGNSVALNTEKQVYFIAKDNATVPAAKAGQAVSVTVSLGAGNAAALSSTAGVTLTVNGTTYTTNASLPGASTSVAKLALTTGADGKAVITYKTVGFTAGDTVVFTATAENFTSTVTGTEATRVFDINDAGSSFAIGTTYISNLQGVVGDPTGSAVAHYTNTATTVDGTAVPVNVVVQDQFGGAPADGTFTVTATWQSSTLNGGTLASTVSSSTSSAVVGGKANLSILDNGTGKATNIYNLELYRVNANGVLSGATLIGVVNVVIADAADTVAGEVLLGGATSKSTTTGIYSITGNNYGSDTSVAYNEELVYSAFANVDRRAVANLAPSNYELDGATPVTNVATVSGTVNSASTATYGGVAVPNASVTVSGAGMQFKAALNSGDVYGDGTLTFPAKNDGTFTIYVWGHLAGKQLVTVKSGTGSAQFYVYFKTARQASASTASVVVADGAAQFQAGRALDVTVKVADKFGNPVQLTGAASGSTSAAGTTGKLVLSQTGSGYLSATSTTTDETGAFTTKLITNAGDLGTSTITAKVDFDNTADLVDLTKSVSSEFGVTDADVTVGGRAVYASVEFAKGKTVTVSVDGRRLYSKLFSTDAYTELKFTQKKAGKHTVTVRISGGIVYSEVVNTTK